MSLKWNEVLDRSQYSASGPMLPLTLARSMRHGSLSDVMYITAFLYHPALISLTDLNDKNQRESLDERDRHDNAS